MICNWFKSMFGTFCYGKFCICFIIHGSHTQKDDSEDDDDDDNDDDDDKI